MGSERRVCEKCGFPSYPFVGCHCGFESIEPARPSAPTTPTGEALPFSAEEEDRVRNLLRTIPQRWHEWALVLQDADRLVATLDDERTARRTAEAERDDAREIAHARALHAERLRAALESSLHIIDGIYKYGVPRSCGACGTPDAACDGDCMSASYLARDIGRVREALTATPPTAAVETLREAIRARLDTGHDSECPRVMQAEEWRGDPPDVESCNCGHEGLARAATALGLI